MNIYSLARLVSSSLPSPFKRMGIWGLHVFGRRNIVVFLDPVMGCNLRCRMCYFSASPSLRPKAATMTAEQIDHAEKALFHRAVKLQIGCGAEPTLYPDLASLIRRGKNAGIPYISLTTNGQLIATGKVRLLHLVESGLDELTLSLHGTDAETYETLMTGARFENLLTLIRQIELIRGQYPDFRLRINFTFNSLNADGLKDNRFWKLWPAAAMPDIIQLRPVQNLGESDWRDFDLSKIMDTYDETIGAIAAEAKHRGISCIAPSIHQLEAVATEQDPTASIIEEITYCTVDPSICYKTDFMPDDTYETYHRRHRTGHLLFQAIFNPSAGRKSKRTKKLNYKVN